MAAFVEEHGARVLGDDPFDLEGIGARLAEIPGHTGAKMALDGALHDWIGKRAGLPVWKLLGVSMATMPQTSYTIGIDTVEGTADKTRRAARYGVLKVKVGGAGRPRPAAGDPARCPTRRCGSTATRAGRWRPRAS